MRKLLPIAAAGALMTMIACDEAPKNPGDFTVASKVEIAYFKSLTTNAEYKLEVDSEKDTVWTYPQYKRDTLKGADGKPVIGDNGKLVVKVDTLKVPGWTKGHLIHYKDVVLPSYPDVPFDTLEIRLNSNANWLAPAPPSTVNWFSNINASTAGGGDGMVQFTIKQFSGTTSKWTAEQIIMSKDSTVMMVIPIKHTGLKYKP